MLPSLLKTPNKNPCNCHSYNMDSPKSGKEQEVILTPPKEFGIGKDTLCVDACIAKVVKHLWANGIVTLGSCCGHNRTMPSFVLTQDYNKQDAEKIKKLIKEVDDREFELCNWQLVVL